MSREVVKQGNQLSQAGISADPNVFLGLSDAQRLSLLSQAPDVVPPRFVKFDEATDPSGLLEQEDTYEALAGLIFQECEGIYRQLVLSRPEVRQQFMRSHRNPGKFPTIRLPATKLTELYTFEMVRTADAVSTQFLFHRADSGYEDRGFLVRKQEDGHIVLKNIDPGETDTVDDKKYFELLHNAQNWVRNYSASLNIQPAVLLNLSTMNIDPPSKASRAANLGKKAVDASLNALPSIAKSFKNLVTVEKPIYDNLRGPDGPIPRGYQRGPRLAVVAAAVALIPIPGHGLLGEVTGKAAWDITTGAPGAVIYGINEFFNGGDKTINIGVACPQGESPRVVSADTSWDGHLTVGCVDAAGEDHAPQALKLPNIDDGNPIKPNYRLSARVNNQGEFLLTQEAYVNHDLASDTPQSQTIQFGGTESIKEVKIEKVDPNG